MIRKIKKPKKGKSISIHITIPWKLYERISIYQNELVGQPSLSGIAETAFRQLLDDACYLGDV